MIRPLALLLGLLPAPALADWAAEKCALYGRAWSYLTAEGGDARLSSGFASGNRRFIDSGCTDRTPVCPTTEEDLKAADTLTLMIVMEGATGSFLPFGCAKTDEGMPRVN